MRKRAQWRGTPLPDETKYTVGSTEPVIEKKPFKFKKNWWIAVALVGIFFLTLFLNTYYNVISEVTVNPDGEGIEKFYLSGPDPYYNLRLVQGTYETGRYPYFHTRDPLLNYPIGAEGGRAPLFNMMALGFSRFLTPFMDEPQAIGYSMQFLPALCGALLIFVVYFIGKELFNKKVGLIAAMFVAIIPVHLSSGHGSAYGLFDHDSFNLLLFFLTFLFLIKSIKEKDSMKSFLYAILGGVPLAGLSLTWVEAHYLYVIIAVYAIVLMIIDIFTNKIEFKVFRTTSVLVWVGYLISLPVIAITQTGFSTNITFYICCGITVFGAIYYMIGRLKIPWTLSLPGIFLTGAAGLATIYLAGRFAGSSPILAPLKSLSETIFGVGIYGYKVSMTIAEANTYEISQTVMSFGPALYWIGWAGFLFLCYRYYKNKYRKDYLFIIVLFVMDIWLTGVAGRFINDMVPLIALLGAWIVYLFVDRINYKQMIRNIRAAGGGFHGVRKGIKLLHIFGILFIAFIVILPNVFIAFDAAIPSAVDPKSPEDEQKALKTTMFGEEHQGAFGMGIYKEKYWADALTWLSEQDTNIENPAERPAFISWWDYGFYEVALGAHPTVADNFQDGIPTAANFHTSTSEKEAVSVWIIRLLEGNENLNVGSLSEDVIGVLSDHLGKNNSDLIVKWMDNFISPSSGTPIGEEYDESSSQQYHVGQQYPQNAVYHDIVELLNNTLDEEGVTWLYHDLQNVTGWSIRYYGVEGYDRQIFNIFSFLSDKSLLLVNGVGDDFIDLQYVGYTVDSQGKKEQDMVWTAKQIKTMDSADRSHIAVTSTQQVYKDPYFETMFYKTYIGPYQYDQTTGDKQEYDYQVPCYDMKHFYAEYLSDMALYPYYDTGKAAVVIAKYYEGAYVNGTATFLGEPFTAGITVMKNLTYSSFRDISYPVEHDRMSLKTDGNFNLIAGADTWLQVVRNFGQYLPPFILKNVTFDGVAGSETAPISDDDAMRQGDNYERTVNITIHPALVQGYIYADSDDSGSFGQSVDAPIKNVNVSLYELLSSTQSRLAGVVADDINGSFNASDLVPSYYFVRAEKNGFIINETLIPLYENENYCNFSEMKHSSITGKVNYSDDEISDANVELIYKRMTIDGKTVEKEILAGTTTTDGAGKYTFSDLVPGEYNLTVAKGNSYRLIKEITIEEDATMSYNVTLDLMPVTTSGSTKYNNQAVGAIQITFSPDGLEEDNTAKTSQTTSAQNGSYSINLMPGYYNVTVEKKTGDVLIYSYTGKLVLPIGKGTETYDIPLTKNSITVSGYTSYAGANVVNVTNIKFEPDSNVVNNTAKSSSTISSNSAGYYTVELSPGSYNVSVYHEFNQSGQNYTYTFEGKKDISSTDPITYNIAMSRVERD